MRARLLSTAAVLLALSYPAMATAQDQTQNQGEQQQIQQQPQGQQMGGQQGQPQMQKVQQALRQAEQSLQQNDQPGAQQALDEARQALQQAEHQAQGQQQEMLTKVEEAIQQAEDALQRQDSQGAQQAVTQATQATQGQAGQQGAAVAVTPADEDADVAVVEEEPMDAADQDAMPGTPERGEMTEQQATVEPQQGQDRVDTDELIGMTARTPEGEDLGKIGDLVLTEQGEVEAAIIEVGGFLGIGAKQVAVDWNRVRISPENDQVVVNMTREELEAAPEYEDTAEQQMPQEPEQAVPDAGQ